MIESFTFAFITFKTFFMLSRWGRFTANFWVEFQVI